MKTDGINLKQWVNYRRQGYHSCKRHSLVMRRKTQRGILVADRMCLQPPDHYLTHDLCHSDETTFHRSCPRYIWKLCACSKDFLFLIRRPLNSKQHCIQNQYHFSKSAGKNNDHKRHVCLYISTMNNLVWRFMFERQGAAMNRKHSFSWILIIIHRVLVWHRVILI